MATIHSRQFPSREGRELLLLKFALLSWEMCSQTVLSPSGVGFEAWLLVSWGLVCAERLSNHGPRARAKGVWSDSWRLALGWGPWVLVSKLEECLLQMLNFTEASSSYIGSIEAGAVAEFGAVMMRPGTGISRGSSYSSSSEDARVQMTWASAFGFCLGM